MAERFDVVIVGAGIVGTACALELAEAGLLVCVLEADEVGSGATAAGMGHIVVMDDSPAQLLLTRYSQILWGSMADELGTGTEYTQSGTVWVAADDEEMIAVHDKHAAYRAAGVPTEILDRHALYEAEPNLRPGLAGGLLVPEDGDVYPPRCAALLLRRAAATGATLRRATVTGLVPGGVQLAGGGAVAGAAVRLANGSRALDLAPDLPIRPKKGHLAITDRYPGFVRHQLVELGYVKKAHSASGDSVSFNVQPRSTGQLLIGSSRQPGVATRDVDAAILAAMLRSALNYLPGIGLLSCIRVWTGLRAATPDGLPLIGPHPTRPCVWLATGHEGLGITTALATAKLLAAQITGRAPEIPAEPYLPSRPFAEAVHG
jgi:glycine/D-amino acid oxidase-like deaminating enzyme